MGSSLESSGEVRFALSCTPCSRQKRKRDLLVISACDQSNTKGYVSIVYIVSHAHVKVFLELEEQAHELPKRIAVMPLQQHI